MSALHRYAYRGWRIVTEDEAGGIETEFPHTCSGPEEALAFKDVLRESLPGSRLRMVEVRWPLLHAERQTLCMKRTAMARRRAGLA